jgi:hypothetical protein
VPRTSTPHKVLARRLDERQAAALVEAEVVALNAEGRAMNTAELWQFTEAVREVAAINSTLEVLGRRPNAAAI